MIAVLRHTMRRDGVTLVEVLMAIGVFIIGLLGVMAVLPLAGRQSQEGLTADRGAEVGRNAYQTFLARGMNDPTFWRVAPAGPITGSEPGTAVTLVDNNTGAPNSFCIDPRFVAQNGSGVPFPFPGSAGIKMQRVTLLNKPATDNSARMMIRPMADNIFMSQDELVFDDASDNLTPPKQKYFKDSAQTNDVRRASLGKVSWFATVVPNVNAATGFADNYILSIIVVNNRDASMSLNPENERVGKITAFHSKGRGGGDVTIAPVDGTLLKDWDLAKDRWVMLAGNTANGPMYRWYRILAVAEANGNYNLTLQGPDWPIVAPDGSAGLINGDTQVVMVTGTVTVFEKTIQLKASGL